MSMNQPYRDRTAELDAYAARLNAAHGAAVAARSAEEQTDGVTLSVEMTPHICEKCGALKREPKTRPDGCPHCTVRYLYQ